MQKLTSDAFTGTVLESDVPVVVDFTADWCPPCRAMKPVLEELAAERPDLKFVAVDVDDQPELAARYGVLSMPTIRSPGRKSARAAGESASVRMTLMPPRSALTSTPTPG